METEIERQFHQKASPKSMKNLLNQWKTEDENRQIV